MHAGRVEFERIDDIEARTFGHGDDVVEFRCNALLHADKGVPAAHQQALFPGFRRGQRQFPVTGDRVMDGGDQRLTLSLQGQGAVAQRLIVVDDVIGRFVRAEVAGKPAAERIGFRKTAGQHAEILERIRERREVSGSKRRDMVGSCVQVQRRQRDEPDAVHQRRVGRPGDDVHLVSRPDQCLAEIMQVDALAAAVGVAAITEQGDFQR